MHYITLGNWNVHNIIHPLFIFILPMFENLFGKDIMGNEQCHVYVDAACAIAPIILHNPKRIVLRSNNICTCALVFELAHELTHYAIMQRTNNRYGSTCAVAAFEEAACEAMSLYTLKLCSEQWPDATECNCRLFPTEKNLNNNFENYRAKIYFNVSITSNYSTYEEWSSICDKFTGRLTSTTQRPDVSAMRNHLYDSFVQMPSEIINILDYPLYLRNIPFDKLIDDDRWKVDKPRSATFIKEICSIQPVLKIG